MFGFGFTADSRPIYCKGEASLSRFEQQYEEWLQEQIHAETSSIRLEFLNKGLGHGTIEFLRSIWFPAVGNFKSLYAEWEVRDFNNGYRYLDLAYMPGGAKGGIEIQGFGPHARDLDVRAVQRLMPTALSISAGRLDFFAHRLSVYYRRASALPAARACVHWQIRCY